jgi:flagellar biosynthesis/type III secretory pathway ATPase
MFVCGDWMKGERYKRRVDRRDELLARVLDAAGSIMKSEDQLTRGKKNAIFAHELQSTLRSTAGFSKCLLLTVPRLIMSV